MFRSTTAVRALRVHFPKASGSIQRWVRSYPMAWYLDISPPTDAFSADVQSDFPLRTSGTASDISYDPASEDCIAVVKSWISSCRQQHPTCGSFLSTPLPRRVVDVGSHGTEPVLRLYETEGEQAPYIALSHCWGTEQNYTTTTSTLRQRCAGLDWGLLPKTFKDAVTLSRKLAIPYVWIDSVCIVQDDKYAPSFRDFDTILVRTTHSLSVT